MSEVMSTPFMVGLVEWNRHSAMVVGAHPIVVQCSVEVA